MSANRSIKVGIVGLGRSGWNLHAKALTADPQYRITAVCDQSVQRLDQAKRELGCEVYDDFYAFLGHPELELVIIASTTKNHVWMARAALEKGLHVVLEKPLAASVAEVLELKKASQQYKRILSPYFNFRFKPDFVLIKKILGEGLIGEPFLIKRQVGYFNRRDDWQSQAGELGGILNADTIHAVDQVIQLAGNLPDDIWRDVRRVVSKGDAPDHSKVLLRFPGGCVGDIEVSWAQALDGYEWLIYGPTGAIRRSGKKLLVRWFAEKDLAETPTSDRSYFSAEKIGWQDRKYDVDDATTPLYYRLLFEAILGRGPVPVELDGAIDTMRVMEKISC